MNSEEYAPSAAEGDEQHETGSARPCPAPPQRPVTSTPVPTAAGQPRRRHAFRPVPGARRRVVQAGLAGAAVIAVGAAFSVGSALRSSPSSATPAASNPVLAAPQWSGPGFSGNRRGGVGGGAGSFTPPGTAQTWTSATAAEEVGVVDIDVVLDGTQRAAGTGMLLTSTGEVLTNRHVVEGETSISVTVAATGQTYAARVVGMSTTTDVAVVQLEGAAGLATVKTATSTVALADTVVGVGNAGGTGGTPSAAAGTVTGVDQSIVASDVDGSNPERLTGLIETNADIQAGDSGGPLLDASNAAVGMDTAASSAGYDGYAIPIATAVAVAGQIEAGGAGTQSGPGAAPGPSASTTPRAYLGVEVQDGVDGAQVDAVVQGSPAQSVGLTAGDTITSVAGQRVSNTTDLTTVMASLTPGQRVTLTWVDENGATQFAQVAPVPSWG